MLIHGDAPSLLGDPLRCASVGSAAFPFSHGGKAVHDLTPDLGIVWPAPFGSPVCQRLDADSAFVTRYEFVGGDEIVRRIRFAHWCYLLSLASSSGSKTASLIQYDSPIPAFFKSGTSVASGSVMHTTEGIAA